jgi:hypothetical protein
MVATLVTQGAEEAHRLPIPPVAFALIAIAFFGLLLLLTFAFRSVSQRH